MTRVFVYGTLKGGNPIRGLEKFVGTNLIGMARTVDAEWDLISFGAFPAAVAGKNYILGEVWEVSTETFLELDLIEGYPTFYTRKKLMTDQGEAWMYHLAGDPEGHGGSKEGVTHNLDKTVEWNWD